MYGPHRFTFLGSVLYPYLWPVSEAVASPALNSDSDVNVR